MTVKRIFDLIAVIAGTAVIWPLLLFLAVSIRLVDGSPVIYAQTRVGRGGRPFRLYKFRSMHLGVGPRLTVGSDARITPLGRFMRKLKLDELPQLWNVLRGEMSLVGPRPEVEEFVALYSPEQRQVLEFTPGITDPASLKYYNEGELLAAAKEPRQFYIDSVMPDKIRINLDYGKRASLWSDLRLILITILRSVGIVHNS